MIKLISLLNKNNMTESSEEDYEMEKQPSPTCPKIDYLLGELKKIDRELHRWERHKEDAEYLSSVISNVQYSISDFDSKLEEIRSHVEQIRYWGQRWKDYAKEHCPEIN